MTRCVSLVMKRGDPEGSAPTDLDYRNPTLDSKYNAVCVDESKSYRVDVQQCDVALEKSGLKPVPEKIARMLDFQSYFGAGNVRRVILCFTSHEANISIGTQNTHISKHRYHTVLKSHDMKIDTFCVLWAKLQFRLM